MIGTSSPRARKNSCYLARIKEHVCVTRGSIAIIRTIYYSYSCLKEPRKSKGITDIDYQLFPYISATKMQNGPKIQLKIQFFPLSLPY